MKKPILAALALVMVVSSCGPVYLASERGDRRGYDQREYDQRRYDKRGYDNRGYDRRDQRSADAFIMLVQNNPRFRNVTVLIDNRVRVSLGYDNRGRASKAKQIRIKPGRHNIKVYSNGRFLYERWIVATPNRTIRFSV